MSSTTIKDQYAAGTDAEEARRAATVGAVYVYQAPVRLWHWVNALSILVLAVTGYFIGKPLPTQPGEASAHYLMGYIRFAHFAAAYVFTIGLIGRLYWAFVGNHHARELFTLPVRSKAYWKEMVEVLRWYLFLRKHPNRYLGHNPMSRLAMFGFFLLCLFMICTGFALYGEGTLAGSWANRLFSSWVIPLFGQSQDVHTFHRLGMWAMVVFVLMHVYAAVREDIMGRQSIISTMVSGYRFFKK